MKRKTLLFGLLSASVLVGQVACNKTSSDIKLNSTGKQTFLSTNLELLPTYVLGQDILESDFLDNAEDLLDERFNKVEYAMTLGLLEIYKNHPSLMQQVVSDLSSTRNKMYNLFDFENSHPEINAIFDSVYLSRFPNEFSGDWKAFVEQNYRYDVSYTPFFSIANDGENVDYSQIPMIGAGYEIDEEKFPNFDDNIPLWITDENGDLRFSTVNYQSSVLLENPIIVISNGFNGDESEVCAKSLAFSEVGWTSGPDHVDGPIIGDPGPGTIAAKGCGLTTHFHENVNHNEFKINERFEATGKSDYQVVWAATLSYTPTTTGYVWQPKLGDRIFAKGKKVDKNEIGTLLNSFEFTLWSKDLYTNPQCFDLNATAFSATSTQCYAVGMCEFDWFRTGKDLFSFLSFNGSTPDNRTYKEKRKYNSDWYFFDPATNNSYPFLDRNPTQHSTFYNYTKGEVRIHRWN